MAKLEAGSNPTFNVGATKSEISKKGIGSSNKKKEGDPTRINRGVKSITSNRREMVITVGKITGRSAPTITRPVGYKRWNKKLSRSKTTTT